MGTTLSVDVGWGILLPWGDDEDRDFSTDDFYSQYVSYDDDDDPDHEYGTVDNYEVGDAVERRFPLLTVEYSYYHDYQSDAALLVKSSVTSGYGASVEPFTITAVSAEEDAQLREAAELLGVEYTPTWLIVPSLG